MLIYKIHQRVYNCRAWLFHFTNDEIMIYVKKNSVSYYRNTPNGAWSFVGSKLVTTSEGITVCQYDHTTNFALLMSPGRAVSI